MKVLCRIFGHKFSYPRRGDGRYYCKRCKRFGYDKNWKNFWTNPKLAIMKILDK